MSQTDSSSTEKRPTHEAHWVEESARQGMTIVCIARFKAGGARVEVGSFVVDTWCLGVKDVGYYDLARESYRAEYLRRLYDHHQMEKAEPCCARKLVEEAIRYAAYLGFGPHPDFKKGARVFGGINASECSRPFVFGHDGKPHYFQGPHETPAQADAIVRRLRLRCGEGNFHFTIALGGPGGLGSLFDD